MRHRTLTLLSLIGLSLPLAAQSNTVPGLDLSLSRIRNIDSRGRTGAFPNGLNGISFETTICNNGTVTVPWESPMDPDHPFITFLFARDDGERMVQISDRSWVKHGFFAITGSFCTPCQGGDPFGGTFLGLGCSDTYDNNNNANNFYLGPPDEIDPWLGEWDPVCSHFDNGEPLVAPGNQCDGNRSLTMSQANNLGPIGHRIRVLDQDLMSTGSESWFYQAYYVAEGEGESVRGNNIGNRGFNPTWDGNEWTFNNTGPFQNGSVLERWSGASVDSNTNGGDDGRLYVAVKVTGPVDGIYHYEYAFQNRDNNRGVGAFRLPVCDEAVVTNVGFRDIDQGAANDWTFSRNAGELVWSTPDNPLRWNSVFNVWFDSDAAPIAGQSVTLDQFDAGPGAASVLVNTQTPEGSYNVNLGDGCSLGTAPRIFAEGTPDRGTLGNNTLELVTQDNAPGGLVVLFYSPVDALVDFGGGCFSYVSNTLLDTRIKFADGAGEARFGFPIPNDNVLEGIHVNAQILEYQPGAGAFATDFDLSNGLRVRLGDSIAGCP